MLETLISLDILALESIRTAFHVDSDWFHTLIFILADSEWIFIAVFLVILWLIGTKKNDTSYKVQSLNIFYMIVGGFILYIILNQFLPVRPRPETVSHIPPLLHHLPDNSFPSGHAIFAAASWLGVRIFT